MFKFQTLLTALAASASFMCVAAAYAATPSATVIVDSSLVTPVADGCGPNGWRGRWGHCHYGRSWVVPPVYIAPGFVRAPVYNGCPPGFWRGPWGQCRNTPYHGRLPGGGWQ